MGSNDGKWPCGLGAAEELARGSSATILLTRFASFGPTVVKVVHPHLAGGRKGQRLRKRLSETLAAHAGVSNEHLVELYAAGHTPDGLPAIAVEHVNGVTAGELMRPGAAVTLGEMGVLIRDVAAGLAALHEHGLVHGGVCPGNIIYAADEVAPRAKLTRFAMGSLVPAALTPSSTSPRAPECYLGRAGPASDIYGLGLIAWRCLAGAPLRATIGSVDDLVYHRLTPEPPPDVGTEDPAITPALRAFVGRMLSPNPDHRPTAAEIARAWPKLIAEQGGPSPAPRECDAQSSAQPEAPTRILVVDDDPLRQLLLTSWLRRSGCEVMEQDQMLQSLDALEVETVFAASSMIAPYLRATMAMTRRNAPRVLLYASEDDAAVSNSAAVFRLPGQLEHLLAAR